MRKEIIASGRDLNEAKENARLALGAGELDDVTFEIIDLGSKGILFGIGAKPAKVKASMEFQLQKIYQFRVLSEAHGLLEQRLCSRSSQIHEH